MESSIDKFNKASFENCWVERSKDGSIYLKENKSTFFSNAIVRLFSGIFKGSIEETNLTELKSEISKKVIQDIGNIADPTIADHAPSMKDFQTTAKALNKFVMLVNQQVDEKDREGLLLPVLGSTVNAINSKMEDFKVSQDDYKEKLTKIIETAFPKEQKKPATAIDVDVKLIELEKILLASALSAKREKVREEGAALEHSTDKATLEGLSDGIKIEDAADFNELLKNERALEQLKQAITIQKTVGVVTQALPKDINDMGSWIDGQSQSYMDTIYDKYGLEEGGVLDDLSKNEVYPWAITKDDAGFSLVYMSKSGEKEERLQLKDGKINGCTTIEELVKKRGIEPEHSPKFVNEFYAQVRADNQEMLDHLDEISQKYQLASEETIQGFNQYGICPWAVEEDDYGFSLVYMSEGVEQREPLELKDEKINGFVTIEDLVASKGIDSGHSVGFVKQFNKWADRFRVDPEHSSDNMKDLVADLEGNIPVGDRGYCAVRDGDNIRIIMVDQGETSYFQVMIEGEKIRIDQYIDRESSYEVTSEDFLGDFLGKLSEIPTLSDWKKINANIQEIEKKLVDKGLYAEEANFIRDVQTYLSDQSNIVFFCKDPNGIFNCIRSVPKGIEIVQVLVSAEGDLRVEGDEQREYENLDVLLEELQEEFEPKTVAVLKKDIENEKILIENCEENVNYKGNTSLNAVQRDMITYVNTLGDAANGYWCINKDSGVLSAGYYITYVQNGDIKSEKITKSRTLETIQTENSLDVGKTIETLEKNHKDYLSAKQHLSTKSGYIEHADDDKLKADFSSFAERAGGDKLYEGTYAFFDGETPSVVNGYRIIDGKVASISIDLAKVPGKYTVGDAVYETREALLTGLQCTKAFDDAKAKMQENLDAGRSGIESLEQFEKGWNDGWSNVQRECTVLLGQLPPNSAIWTIGPPPKEGFYAAVAAVKDTVASTVAEMPVLGRIASGLYAIGNGVYSLTSGGEVDFKKVTETKYRISVFVTDKNNADNIILKNYIVQPNVDGENYTITDPDNPSYALSCPKGDLKDAVEALTTGIAQREVAFCDREDAHEINKAIKNQETVLKKLSLPDAESKLDQVRGRDVYVIEHVDLSRELSFAAGKKQQITKPQFLIKWYEGNTVHSAEIDLLTKPGEQYVKYQNKIMSEAEFKRDVLGNKAVLTKSGYTQLMKPIVLHTEQEPGFMTTMTSFVSNKASAVFQRRQNFNREIETFFSVERLIDATGASSVKYGIQQLIDVRETGEEPKFLQELIRCSGGVTESETELGRSIVEKIMEQTGSNKKELLEAVDTLINESRLSKDTGNVKKTINVCHALQRFASNEAGPQKIQQSSRRREPAVENAIKAINNWEKPQSEDALGVFASLANGYTQGRGLTENYTAPMRTLKQLYSEKKYEDAGAIVHAVVKQYGLENRIQGDLKTLRKDFPEFCRVFEHFYPESIQGSLGTEKVSSATTQGVSKGVGKSKEKAIDASEIAMLQSQESIDTLIEELGKPKNKKVEENIQKAIGSCLESKLEKLREIDIDTIEDIEEIETLRGTVNELYGILSSIHETQEEDLQSRIDELSDAIDERMYNIDFAFEDEKIDVAVIAETEQEKNKYKDLSKEFNVLLRKNQDGWTNTLEQDLEDISAKIPQESLIEDKYKKLGKKIDLLRSIVEYDEQLEELDEKLNQLSASKKRNEQEINGIIEQLSNIQGELFEIEENGQKDLENLVNKVQGRLEGLEVFADGLLPKVEKGKKAKVIVVETGHKKKLEKIVSTKAIDTLLKGMRSDSRNKLNAKQQENFERAAKNLENLLQSDGFKKLGPSSTAHEEILRAYEVLKEAASTGVAGEVYVKYEHAFSKRPDFVEMSKPDRTRMLDKTAIYLAKLHNQLNAKTK